MEDLVDPLLDHAHVDEHVAFSDALVAQEVLVERLVTFYHLGDLLDAFFHLLDFLEVLFLLLFHAGDGFVGRYQFDLKLLDHTSLLRVLATLGEVPVDLRLHLEDLRI